MQSRSRNSLVFACPRPRPVHTARTHTDRLTETQSTGRTEDKQDGMGRIHNGERVAEAETGSVYPLLLSHSDADVSSGRSCCNRGTEPHLLISSSSALLCSTTLAFALLCFALLCSLPSPQFRAGRIVPPPIIYLLRARQPAQPRLHLSAASFSCYDFCHASPASPGLSFSTSPCGTRTRPAPPLP